MTFAVAPPAPGGDPDRRAYFLHIPKTAGTTLDAYLRSMYQDDEICPAQLWDTLMVIPPEELERYRFLHGHFGAALLSLVDDDPAMLTMLREPRARSISAYRHLIRDGAMRRRAVGPRYAELNRVSPDIGSFLRHPDARLLIENTQARYLCVDEPPTEVLEGPAGRDEAQTRFELVEPPPDDELQARALERLHTCAWVGVAERFPESLRLLAHAMRWSHPGELVSLNHSHVNGQRIALTSADEDLLAELTRVDRVVYAEACRLLDEQWQAFLALASASWCAEELARRAAPLVGEVAVSTGDPHWGGGWWPRERDPKGDGWIAWTGPGTTAWIDLPIVLAPGDRIDALVRLAMPGVVADATTLEVNGVELPVEITGHTDGWLVGATVPAGAVGPWTRAVVRTATTGRLADVGGERGPRGVAVSWVRLRAATCS